MKGTTSFSSSVLSYRVYSTGSTLVPCGPAQRDTRLCLPGKSRLFGMRRRPLHARIIVNSKGAQKPAFYLPFPDWLSAWSARCACMIPGIATGMSVSRNKGFRGLSSPPRAVVNNASRVRVRGFNKISSVKRNCLSRSVWLWEIWKNIISMRLL